jgi:hypothetical protein
MTKTLKTPLRNGFNLKAGTGDWRIWGRGVPLCLRRFTSTLVNAGRRRRPGCPRTARGAPTDGRLGSLNSMCSVVRAACECAQCTRPDTCRACSKGRRCWPLFATVHSGWCGPEKAWVKLPHHSVHATRLTFASSDNDSTGVPLNEKSELLLAHLRGDIDFEANLAEYYRRAKSTKPKADP